MEPAILLEALRNAMTRLLAEEKRAAVAYSGGLDSSLIAKIAGETASVICYACATEGSYDAGNALGYGSADGFEVRMLPLTEREFPGIISRTAAAMETTDPLVISYSVPLVVALERCEEGTLLAGNGADELFAGYARYAQDPSIYGPEMQKDIDKARKEAMKLKVFAESLGKRVEFPFLEDEMVAIGMRTPFGQKVSAGRRKGILREAGGLAGLSAADRPKKAAQYSSGTLKMMKALARRNHQTLDEWTRNAASARNEGGKD